MHVQRVQLVSDDEDDEDYTEEWLSELTRRVTLEGASRMLCEVLGVSPSTLYRAVRALSHEKRAWEHPLVVSLREYCTSQEEE